MPAATDLSAGEVEVVGDEPVQRQTNPSVVAERERAATLKAQQAQGISGTATLQVAAAPRSVKKSSSMSMLDARIEELIYLGDHIRCRMNVAGDDQFIVKVPNTSGQLGLEIGANLFVGWNTEDCRALDFRQQV